MLNKSHTADRWDRDLLLADLKTVTNSLAFGARVSIDEAAPVEWLPLLQELGRALELATAETRERARNLLAAHLDTNPDSPLVGSVSVFEALGHCRYELAHTQALAWLLNPPGRHGFGTALIHALLKGIRTDERFDHQVLEEVTRMIDGGSAWASAEHWLSDSCRADVLLEGRSGKGRPWSIVIEAKIDAVERDDQLRDVLLHAPHPLKFGVFITPEGIAGSTGDYNWARISYFQWARELLRLQPELSGRPGASFLRLYISGLLEDVCGIVGGENQEDVIRRNSPFEIEELLERVNGY
jgi:hypothetical protein